MLRRPIRVLASTAIPAGARPLPAYRTLLAAESFRHQSGCREHATVYASYGSIRVGHSGPPRWGRRILSGFHASFGRDAG